MKHEELLDKYTELIERQLVPYFEELSWEGKKYHPFIGRVYDALSEFVLRKGKRLASSSALLTYKGYTGNIDRKILKVGLGVELYRHCILIHDDLVDRDDYRRGGKTFHKLFEKDQRHGAGIAIFAGDLVYSLALNAILNSGFDSKKIEKVVGLFARDYCAVNESQILDLSFEYSKPDEEEWYAMASKRASSLFHATILTGAIFGGASKRDLKLLEDASHHIGYSFDIQDDIIGTFATEEQYGRPPGGDLVFWKKPLHMVYTLEMAKKRDIEEIESAVGKPEKIERIREIVRNCGALEKAKEKSRWHAGEAIRKINKTKLDSETKAFFSSFIEYVAGSLDWYK